MKIIKLQISIFLIAVVLVGCKKENSSNTVTDIDGNVYQTVTIGTQIWMKENLKVTKYRNGAAIPNITDGTTWSSLTTGAYCDYSNTPANSAIYGKLYNWYTVSDSRNLAPAGWHVPTAGEWNILVTFLGGNAFAGGKLRETGTTHWLSPNTTATNESGFTGLGTGYRKPDGGYISFNFNTYFWTSTAFDAIQSYDFGFFHLDIVAYQYEDDKTTGFPVRCIKD